jgi:hypothetical protein
VFRDAKLNAAPDGAADPEKAARIEGYAQMDEALRDGAARLIDNDPAFAARRARGTFANARPRRRPLLGPLSSGELVGEIPSAKLARRQAE